MRRHRSSTQRTRAKWKLELGFTNQEVPHRVLTAVSVPWRIRGKNPSAGSGKGARSGGSAVGAGGISPFTPGVSSAGGDVRGPAQESDRSVVAARRASESGRRRRPRRGLPPTRSRPYSAARGSSRQPAGHHSVALAPHTVPRPQRYFSSSARRPAAASPACVWARLD